MKTELSFDLSNFANHLILQDAFRSDIGLFSGKTGSLIFFFHYSAYTKNPLYERYAEKLLNEICENITTDLNFHFHNGFCGIGWTMEYLMTQCYLVGDSDVALSDIDHLVMQYDPVYITTYSLEDGLEGIVYYVMSRLCSKRTNKDYIPFKPEYLERLRSTCLMIPVENRTEIVCSYINGELNMPYTECLLKILSMIRINLENESINWSTGLKMLLE
ncbi:hypothetical protein J8K86_20765 [Bacteroides fragilis]|uniref:hypothetical protein n=1 Tax=Bacteroides fragilis TaxID=817 RepID=UPI00202F484A|nr:hypothetical protein [Bacteroides fragilis]MCM0344206.1 hypothetical protein [Bacteroides fragilis]WMI92866.1 hypothetical protein BFGS084_00245 [Bacteroides fragilis]